MPGRVGVERHREGRAVAEAPVVGVVEGEVGHVLRPAVLRHEDAVGAGHVRRVVVDVGECEEERGGGRAGRLPPVHGQHEDGVVRRRLAVQPALQAHAARTIHGEPPPGVARGRYRVMHLALAALVPASAKETDTFSYMKEDDMCKCTYVCVSTSHKGPLFAPYLVPVGGCEGGERAADGDVLGEREVDQFRGELRRVVVVVQELDQHPRRVHVLAALPVGVALKRGRTKTI